MQQLNVCGCRGYLQNVGSNQRLPLSSIVTTKDPFESLLIHFKYNELNTLRSICTISGSLCMMVPLFYYSVHLQNKLQTSSPIFCEKTLSNLKSLLGIADHAVNHDWWQYFQILFYCPCLRKDFPTGFLPLSLVKWTCSM